MQQKSRIAALTADHKQWISVIISYSLPLISQWALSFLGCIDRMTKKSYSYCNWGRSFLCYHNQCIILIYLLCKNQLPLKKVLIHRKRQFLKVTSQNMSSTWSLGEAFPLFKLPSSSQSTSKILSFWKHQTE